jgi:hypothetical protein
MRLSSNRPDIPAITAHEKISVQPRAGVVREIPSFVVLRKKISGSESMCLIEGRREQYPAAERFTFSA